MFSDAPDSAARAFFYTGTLWLLTGAACLAVAALQLVSPDFLGLGYGKLMATASVTLIYGWLDLASLGAVFYLVPRLAGTRIKETPGVVAAVVLNACLVLLLLITMGGAQGRPFADMPGWMFDLWLFAHLVAAVAVLSTLSLSKVKGTFAGTWHLGAAVVSMPLVLGLARLPHLTGASGVLADGFGTNGVLMLWLAPVGIASSYYVAARASGRPFFNQRVALAGFWVLVFAGPLAGAGRQMFGPVPAWVQSVGTAASIALIATGLAALVGVIKTVSWDRAVAHPSLKFMATGSIVFFLATIQGAALSMRSVARTLGTTGAVESQVWLLLTAFSLWMIGLIVFALPRLMGRRWLSAAAISQTFWLMVSGSVLFAGGMLVAGALHAAVINAGVATEAPLSSGQPFDVVLSTLARVRMLQAAGAGILFLAAALFVANILRSTAMGDTRPIEVVVESAA